MVRKQRVKSDKEYNTWQKNIIWFTQRFNTRPTSFQHLCQFKSIDIASYGDGTKPYVCYINIDLISKKVEINGNKIM